MKKTLRIFITASFLILNFVSFGQNLTGTKADTITKKITSEFFKNERVIKIFVPKNYNTEKKYPVIYTLDGYGLFHITSTYSHYLMEYDVIPKSIVVSIYHNNRGYETTPNYGQNRNVPLTEFLEGSANLKNHLLREIQPLIEKEFSTSKFNVLIGHSNTANFVNQIISDKDNPFSSFIAITPDPNEEQIIQLEQFIKNSNEEISYFVASGLRDDIFRLEDDKELYTIFKKANPNFKGVFKTYNAGHLDLVPKSLNDGLIFAFSDYRNFSNINDVINKNNFSIKNYINDVISKQSNKYDIDSKLNEDDFFYLKGTVARIKNKRLVKEILDISEVNKFYTEGYLYSDKAQFFEDAGFFKEALENWKLQIENGYNKNIFFYERPFLLLNGVLNQPEEAIEFSETASKKYPKGKLIFNYFIAETVYKHNINRKKGIKAINYCINNFKKNSKFSLESAKKLKSKIEQK